MIYVVVLIYPLVFIPLYKFGLENEIFYIGEREYSADLKLWSIFFATSPMLAFSIAYYVQMAIVSFQKRAYIILATISIVGMFLAGTRNNMVTSILLPTVLLILGSRHKVLFSAISFCFFIGFANYFSGSILTMLDPLEKSNNTKLGMLSDYATIFSNPVDLLFGQGIGSYYNWKFRGANFVTELTYLEIIRNFGIIMGLIIFQLLLYPVVYAFYLNKSFKEKHLIVAYIFYLLMSITNPLFFASLGMLILSILLANIFIERYKLSIERTEKKRNIG
jgi:hypothetical protein